MSSGSQHRISAPKPVLVRPPEPHCPETVAKTGNLASFEFLDSKGLAAKVNLPASWIESHAQPGCLDPVPSFKFGRYRRYAWPSSELLAWLERHLETR